MRGLINKSMQELERMVPAKVVWARDPLRWIRRNAHKVDFFMGGSSYLRTARARRRHVLGAYLPYLRGVPAYKPGILLGVFFPVFFATGRKPPCPIVVVSSSLPLAGRLGLLAHEVGHALDYDLDPDAWLHHGLMEEEANAEMFALEFLSHNGLMKLAMNHYNYLKTEKFLPVHALMLLEDKEAFKELWRKFRRSQQDGR